MPVIYTKADIRHAEAGFHKLREAKDARGISWDSLLAALDISKDAVRGWRKRGYVGRCAAAAIHSLNIGVTVSDMVPGATEEDIPKLLLEFKRRRAHYSPRRPKPALIRKIKRTPVHADELI